MKVHLKVKNKSLADEAKIIRLEEYKAKKRQKQPFDRQWDARMSLAEHRRFVVRPERRSAHIAYGFLCGTPYKAIEAKCYHPPIWSRVEGLVKKYGEGDKRDLMQKFSEWKDAS